MTQQATRVINVPLRLENLVLIQAICFDLGIVVDTTTLSVSIVDSPEISKVCKTHIVTCSFPKTFIEPSCKEYTHIHCCACVTLAIGIIYMI